MDLGLSGRAIIVTAASRGLGFATARALAREGASLVICARGLDRVTSAAETLARETGVEVVPVAGDVRDDTDVTTMRDVALERFGRIDGLFVNAGGPPLGGFLDFTVSDWRQAARLTLESALSLIYAVVPIMREQGGGAILANTSVSVRYPLDGLILSNSLRLAVVGLVKSLSIELGPYGIRANALAPGWTRTQRVEQLLLARAKAHGTTVEEEATAIAESIPLRRMAEPHEYGRVAAFLLSPAASYVTGVALLVDGGMARAIP